MVRSRSRPSADPSRRAGRWLIAAAVALGLAGGGADQARARLDRWIAATPLPALSVPVGTEVLARDGSLLRAFQVGNGLWRLAPPDGGVDPRYLAMLLAWEDRRFHDHPGVDPRAILRAAGQAALHGRVVSGASTLPMQVARLIERGPTGRWSGKLRQARLALALERRLGKDGIIELYLRLAPYGGNVEGLRAASLMWLGKEPRRLTPAEAAMLVALPQSPETRRPDRAQGRRALLAARARVLSRARAAGIIDAEAEAAALATPLPTRRMAFPAHAALLAERLHRANPGAPRIETTIDPGLQRAAEAAIARAVAGQPGTVSAAALIADHRSGEILASVGTARWSDEPSAGFVDMTQVLRSPGSTLKPFVYALGFDDGLIHPETLIEDRPATFGRWQPVNFDHRFRGTVTIRQALTESLNIPVVRIAAALGPARIAAVLRQAGMDLRFAGDGPGLALVLGGGGVSLQDLVQGYASLANGGVAVRLHERPLAGDAAGMGTGQGQGGVAASNGPAAGRGAPSGSAPPAGARIVSPVAAWYVGSILSHVPPPTGAPAGRIAYKTGTSYGHRDALAVGYDGRFVAGVWLGRADGTPVPGAFGGAVAAPALFDLFDALGPRAAPLPPPPPEALTLPTARLPRALRRFAGPGEASPAPAAAGQAGIPAPEALTILFPPEGAAVELAAGRALTARLRGGRPPYVWLLNGRPVARSEAGETATLPAPDPGFSRLSVIDGAGASQAAGFSVIVLPARPLPGRRSSAGPPDRPAGH